MINEPFLPVIWNGSFSISFIYYLHRKPFPTLDRISIHIFIAVLAFMSAVFGPIVGGVIGLLGHALGDALFYGSVWWSWVFPEAVVGVGIGLFARKYAIKEGGFVSTKAIVFFNVVQAVANAIAWIVVAPVLDILVYAEPANKVFAQGFFAWLGNVIIIGILGTILAVAYSKVAGQSRDLKKED